jgi:16S rRNA (uracil1498-N3)-methyltransferase
VPQPPVFLADHAELQRDVILLSGAEGRHAAAVRRLQPGERADVGDGAGLVAECVVTAQSGRGLELAVRARRKVPRPEEMTEVGVDRIMPWAAARCVPVWRAERGARSLARWRVTAREAAKQSRRAWIPEVTEPVSAADVAQVITKAACAIVLEPGAAQSLGHLRPPESGDLVVIVGPEGGITDEENAAFRTAGATPRSLGPTVLRTSTAGTVAAAVLLSRSGRW